MPIYPKPNTIATCVSNMVVFNPDYIEELLAEIKLEENKAQFREKIGNITSFIQDGTIIELDRLTERLRKEALLAVEEVSLGEIMESIESTEEFIAEVNRVLGSSNRTRRSRIEEILKGMIKSANALAICAKEDIVKSENP